MKKSIIIGAILAAVAAGGVYIFGGFGGAPESSESDAAFGAEQNTYTNEAHGFSLPYPASWHEGEGNSADLFQLYNYDVSQVVGGHGWDEGQNKIEGVITQNDSYGTSSTFPEESREESQVTVDGREATRYEIVLESGTNIRSYVVPLQNAAEEHLIVTMYGNDADNFDILDTAMQNLTFSGE